MSVSAYEILAAQPDSPRRVSPELRARIVVSAVIGPDGVEHPVSYFGDDTWDLSPLFQQSNVNESRKSIVWPSDVPAEMVDDTKAVIYAWMKRGRPGVQPAKAVSAVKTVVQSAKPMMRWLRDLRVSRFDEIRPLHVSNFVHHCKSAVGQSPDTVRGRLLMLDLLWAFREDTIHPLSFHPWGGSSLAVVSGCKGVRGVDRELEGVGKTPLIPTEVQAQIFDYCEGVVARADAILDEQAAGAVSRYDGGQYLVRDACLYLLSITSGMRNDEVVGIEKGAWRSEVKDGVEYHWVATIEHKTGKGRVEYLVPALTLNVVRILERFAEPFQREIANQIQLLQEDTSDTAAAERQLEMRRLETDSRRLFLTNRGRGGRIATLTNTGCNLALARVAKAAGTDWELTSHQTRRTYARTFVESRMGRSSLVFLKWQFKHSSMSMTQLYAANPRQDRSLYDEILDELTSFKAEVLETWLGDQPLSGGAGREIMAMRAIPIVDRTSLVTLTAEQVHIRATGHGWCLAQERGCGGAGLYESTQCVDCKHGVIDESFASVWEGIYDQQVELLDLDDLGPAALKRAKRDLSLARKVIDDLGIATASYSSTVESIQ